MDRLGAAERRIRVRQHDGRGAVGDKRAVGAPQRPGDERILFGHSVAELVAEILAELRVWVLDPVSVVLGGDPGERLRAVAVALEIEAGDAPEDAGETAFRVALLLTVGGIKRMSPISAPGAVVIFSAPTTSTKRLCRAAMSFSPWRIAAEPVAQAFSTRVAGRKRSAGSISARDADKALFLEAAEIADIDRIDLRRRKPGVADRSAAVPAIRLSRSSPSSFPNFVCAHPTMQPVMTASAPAARKTCRHADDIPQGGVRRAAPLRPPPPLDRKGGARVVRLESEVEHVLQFGGAAEARLQRLAAAHGVDEGLVGVRHGRAFHVAPGLRVHVWRRRRSRSPIFSLSNQISSAPLVPKTPSFMALA